MPSPYTVTAEMVQKTLENTPRMLPSFYVCPYADPAPGKPLDYSLVNYPSRTLACDINLAFFTPSDDTTSGTFGNTISDNYLCHLRDRSAIKQFVVRMKAMNRDILLSYIDAPSIHWDKVDVENFVRNTEGEKAPDGTVFTNDLIDNYQPVGRMWDAETSFGLEMATVMKACFLRGIQLDPDHYRFIYTTYADRDIDQQILNMQLDPDKSEVDKALYELGFRRIADFITMRGSLSWLETMSYGADPAARFQEADNYAVKYLANGDETRRNEMRKFISIGVSADSSTTDAITIASACDPSKEGSYGRFMVWAANCPVGVSLFETMVSARHQPLLTAQAHERVSSAGIKTPKPSTDVITFGNSSRFFKTPITQPTEPTTDPTPVIPVGYGITAAVKNCSVQ